MLRRASRAVEGSPGKSGPSFSRRCCLALPAFAPGPAPGPPRGRGILQGLQQEVNHNEEPRRHLRRERVEFKDRTQIHQVNHGLRHCGHRWSFTCCGTLIFDNYRKARSPCTYLDNKTAVPSPANPISGVFTHFLPQWLQRSPDHRSHAARLLSFRFLSKNTAHQGRHLAWGRRPVARPLGRTAAGATLHGDAWASPHAPRRPPPPTHVFGTRAERGAQIDHHRRRRSYPRPPRGGGGGRFAQCSFYVACPNADIHHPGLPQTMRRQAAPRGLPAPRRHWRRAAVHFPMSSSRCMTRKCPAPDHTQITTPRSPGGEDGAVEDSAEATPTSSCVSGSGRLAWQSTRQHSPTRRGAGKPVARPASALCEEAQGYGSAQLRHAVLWKLRRAKPPGAAGSCDGSIRAGRLPDTATSGLLAQTRGSGEEGERGTCSEAQASPRTGRRLSSRLHGLAIVMEAVVDALDRSGSSKVNACLPRVPAGPFLVVGLLGHCDIKLEVLSVSTLFSSPYIPIKVASQGGGGEHTLYQRKRSSYSVTATRPRSWVRGEGRTSEATAAGI
eukprot:jgi/Botrbrau1/18269/Bobra.0179s0003.1